MSGSFVKSTANSVETCVVGLTDGPKTRPSENHLYDQPWRMCGAFREIAHASFLEHIKPKPDCLAKSTALPRLVDFCRRGAGLAERPCSSSASEQELAQSLSITAHTRSVIWRLRDGSLCQADTSLLVP